MIRSWLAGAVVVPLVGLATATVPAPAPSGQVDLARSAGPSAPVAPVGPVDPYFPDDGQRGLDVRHYDIRVRHDPAVGRLVGRTVVTAVARHTLDRLHLSLWLPVREVRVDGRRVPWRQDAGDLRIRPAPAWRPGERHRVEVGYAGRPARVGPAAGRPFRTDGVESLVAGEPHAAAWWFPANDHPSDRARVDVRIGVPDRPGLRAISGGRLLGETRAGGRRERHWRMAQPVAPYLVLLAVGPYRERVGRALGRPVLDAVSSTLPADRRRVARDLLAGTPEAVRWLQRVIGTPYPFDALGGLVTGLDLGFALETQTRPLYPDLVYEAQLTLVHELAHQWFGDAVPVRRWRDIWLNEGVATYLETRWDAAHGGLPMRAWLHQRYAELTDGEEDAVFWRLRLDDPGPRALFAWPVYLRGAMAVQALRERIGVRDFDRLLRAWAARGRPAGTPAWQREAERISGESLDGFFDAWLRADHAPPRTAENGLARS